MSGMASLRGAVIWAGCAGLTALVSLVAWASPTAAAEGYRVESIEQGAPSEELAQPIAALLNERGWRVVDDSGRNVCELWLARKWQVEAGFAPTAQRQYGLQPGSLFGVVRLTRRGTDLRSQTINRGVYTLRYALIPVDGNHEGASPTRDFLAWVRAADDQNAEPLDPMELQKLSAAAAGANHPAVWCLLKTGDEAAAGSIRQEAEHDWWWLRVVGQAADTEMAADVVVVGHAEQ